MPNACGNRPEPKTEDSLRERGTARLEQRDPAGENFALKEIEGGRWQQQRQHDQRHGDGRRPMAKLIVQTALRVTVCMVGEQRRKAADGSRA